MNATVKCGHCGATLVEGESDAYCPVCLLTLGLSGSGTTTPAETIESVGRYKLMKKIGQGGMGQVYKARDSQLGRTVAIKFLPRQLAESTENLQRFQREASTLSHVSHQNICIVYDVGNSDRGPYIVMEYVQGRSLRAILESDGLTIDQTLDIMLQICVGIKVIHEKGIIHRDIKPSNVMLTDKNVVKLVDFGLAKWNSNPETDWTQQENAMQTRAEFVKTVPGQVVGTPSYMSPEQAAGTAVDVRSDIFSMGALFYGMLAGEPPFSGETPMLTIHSIISRKYRPIREVNPDIPASLETIVDRMLGDLDERFQSIEEIVPPLRQAQAAQGVHRSVSQAPSLREIPSDGYRQAEGPVSTDPAQKKIKLLWLFVPILILLVAAWYFSGLGDWQSRITADPQTPGSAGQSPSPVEPTFGPPPALTAEAPSEIIDPIDHHMVLGVVVDPVPFVDQRNPGTQDVIIADLHRNLQKELVGLLEESGFPVTNVTNAEWNGVYKSMATEKGGFDYGLSVGSLLEKKNANLFLSLTGYRDEEKPTYHFELHFFNLAGQAFLSRAMEIPIESVGENTVSNVRSLFQQWLAETSEKKRAESTGASLSGNGEIPAIEGIVILPAFEEGESPWSAFEFVSQQERSRLQYKFAEKLRGQLAQLNPATKIKISTPSREEWRAARDVDSVETWEDLLGPFGANAVLSIHGKYDERLMTYGVKLELNQMGTTYLQGQHRFAFTQDFFRDNFDEVAHQLLAAPILLPGDNSEDPADGN